MNAAEIIRALDEGRYDAAFSRIYGDVPAAAERYRGLAERFIELYGNSEEAGLFSAPGRTELGGNHTDHQGGHILAASVSLDAAAIAAKNGADMIHICSPRHGKNVVEFTDLAPRESETGRSNSLIRGVAARLTELGFRPEGFDVYMESDVLPGSGLSSSACFEVLVAGIMSRLAGVRLTGVELAQIGKYAENVYFGKPCGLMDQCACGVGGVISACFRSEDEPEVAAIECDLKKYGYALCLIDAGGSHSDLTEEYAAIPAEMRSVACALGRETLGAAAREELYAALYSGALRGAVADRAILRAMHYFDEDRRAVREAAALENGDVEGFLRLVRESGRSSLALLQNIYPSGDTGERSVALAIALAEELLGGSGAARVHGGGFAGTVQAFVPLDMTETFRERMEAVFGPGSCHMVDIRPLGFVRLEAE